MSYHQCGSVHHQDYTNKLPYSNIESGSQVIYVINLSDGINALLYVYTLKTGSTKNENKLQKHWLYLVDTNSLLL